MLRERLVFAAQTIHAGWVPESVFVVAQDDTRAAHAPGTVA